MDELARDPEGVQEAARSTTWPPAARRRSCPPTRSSKLGFKLIIYPNFALLSAITAINKTLAELKDKRTVAGFAKDIASFQEFFNLVGMKEVQEAEAKYGVDEKTRVAY